MIKKTDAKITTIIGILTFVGLCILSDGQIEQKFWSNLMKAASIAVLFRELYIKFLWKHLPKILHGVPIVEGLWDGEYLSTYKHADSSSSAQGTVNIRIVQPSMYEVKIRQSTTESESLSFGEQLAPEADGVFFLKYSFQNIPKAAFRSKSPVNYGFANFKLTEAKEGQSLEGDYFTDRQTSGTIRICKTAAKV